MGKLVLSTGLGFAVPTNEQIKIMSEVGWEGFFSGWQYGEDLKSYAKTAEACGMYYQSVHAPFGNVDKLWESEDEGEKYADEQIRCIQESSEVGVDLVVAHAIIGMERCTPTDLGLKRFERIFKAAEKYGVKVALENTEGEIYVEALMKEFGSLDHVRFCIDTGHEMCYNASRDIIGKYADKLICTHLNDNLGQTGETITWHDDAHLMPFDGIADWNKIAQRLKAAGYNGDLTFELTRTNKPDRHTHDRYAELDFAGFCALALNKAKQFKEIMDK